LLPSRRPWPRSAKEQRALHKDVRKIRQHFEDPNGEKKEARAKNNGFNKPQKVTPELKAFLGIGPDELISRAQVSNFVNKYLETHGLKDGQKIKTDDTLKALLDVPADVQLTFLNIQRYMNKHYIKDETVEKKPRVKKEDAGAGPSDTAPQRRRSCAPRWPSPPPLPRLPKGLKTKPRV
jgi:upstream activation factor subunit UAF30